MRIAMIGLRDIPAKYSGVETAVEEIGTRLAEAGNDISVYCMSGLAADSGSYFRGLRRIEVPTVKSKNLAMIVYSFLSTCHAIYWRYDVVHLHAIGPGSMSLLCWLSRTPVVVTCHGLDYKREKWGLLARSYLRFGEYLSVKFADNVIVVSKSLQKYFQEKYGREVSYIPNASIARQFVEFGDTGIKFGIKKKKYILFVGRLVECKRVDLLIRACPVMNDEFKLVIVGGGPEDIVSALKNIAVSRTDVIFTGPLYGSDLAGILSNALIFVLPSILEGLPIALIEALAYDLPVVVSDIAENLEVVSGNGICCATIVKSDSEYSLRDGLMKGLEIAKNLRGRSCGNADYVSMNYNWDDIATMTLGIYRSVLSDAPQPPSSK